MAYKYRDQERPIQIDGLSETLRALKAIGTPVEEIKDANRKAGELVVRTARNTANFKKETGKLRSTIRVASVSTNVKVRVGSKAVPYGNPIHWGWFRDKKTGIKRNIKPNPFLAKALGYTREEVLNNYVNNIRELIKRHEAKASDLPKL